MKIGKTNAIFGGGGGVLDFVPFVAPESFSSPKKYAAYGCTVNLYEKLKVYKMTYPDADIAFEFDNALPIVDIMSGSTIEVFETVSGVERSVLYTTAARHRFTSGSYKHYLIRRIGSSNSFALPLGAVWAYCWGLNGLGTYQSNFLKYIFFHENTLTGLGTFRETAIEGILRINGGVTNIPTTTFRTCKNLTKVITGDSVSIIAGGNESGAFLNCTGLLEVDLGTGVTSIGTDTFAGCTSLASIICRAYNPPTLAANAFNGIPATTKFYVPHERVNVYKAADGWNAFASRIYSINDL